MVVAQARNLRARAWLWGSTLPPDVDAISLGRLGLWPAAGSEHAASLIALAAAAGGPMLDSDLPAGHLRPVRTAALHRLWAHIVGREPQTRVEPAPLHGRTTAMAKDTFMARDQRGVRRRPTTPSQEID